MSQDVEMKASQMVEEMLTEREIDEVAPTDLFRSKDCSDDPRKNDPDCSCEFDYDYGTCNCDCFRTYSQEIANEAHYPEHWIPIFKQ